MLPCCISKLGNISLSSSMSRVIYRVRHTNTNLVSFSDADWAGDVSDKRSTSTACFFLKNNLVSWYNINVFHFVLAKLCMLLLEVAVVN